MPIEKCQRCVNGQACERQVVNECLPVCAFGNVSGESVEAATIGLNPALNEFFYSDYMTFRDRSQRLATLNDYKLARRADLQKANIDDTKKRREEYFINANRECHSYFKRLQNKICRIKPRWSFVSGRVVHIDMAGCTTRVRWGRLSRTCQNELLINCREHFLTTLSQLPNQTILLPTRLTVIAEMKKLDSFIGQPSDCYLGKIKLGKKEFPVARLI